MAASRSATPRVAMVRARAPAGRAATLSGSATATVRETVRATPPASAAAAGPSGLSAALDPAAVPVANAADRPPGPIRAPLLFLLMTDFTGKHGLIVGVANKRSLAWSIAQATARRGARLALTYQGRFEDHVKELSEGLTPAPLILPCDVASDADIENVFAAVEQEFGGLDFVVHGAAFAPAAELSNRFVQTSRDGFKTALDVSAYSLIALTRACLPLLEKRGGGSVVTLSHIGADRVFPNYNVMGVAKAALESTVRYLAADLGPQNIRVNAVSAGPIKTLASAGIPGLSMMLQAQRERAPLRRGMELGEIADAAVFLLSNASRAITGEVLMVDAGYHIAGI